jgi:CAAX protease family protein
MTSEPTSPAMPLGSLTRLGGLLATSKAAGIGEIAIVLSIPLVAIGIVRLIPGENPDLQQLAVLVAILISVTLAYIGLRLRGQRWGHFGLTLRLSSPRDVGWSVAQSLAAFVAAAGLFIAAGFVFSWIKGGAEQIEATGLEFLSGNMPLLIGTLLIVYITASFSEEVIYRAFLMNRIAELGGGGQTSWIFALILSSAAFGLAHFSWGLVGMVQAGFMGLALGTSYLMFGRRLWVVILAHGYMDTILLVQLGYLSADPASKAL